MGWDGVEWSRVEFKLIYFLYFLNAGPGTDVFSSSKYRGDLPAVHISWNDADAYCRWRNSRYHVYDVINVMRSQPKAAVDFIFF